MSPEQFVAHWSRLVAHWLAASGRPSATQVQDVLDRGLEAVVADLPPRRRGRPSEADLLRCAEAVVTASGLLDVAEYTRTNAPVRNGRMSAAAHYCTQGWRTLCNPSRAFDVWWYWSEYLDPAAETVDPLLHHLLVGRHRGHEPVQPVEPFRTPEPGPAASSSPPRRVCLFAAYDDDSVVDDYVVDYVAELSRFADVYFLADGYVEPEELDRLAPYTKGAWARSHGAYDFGSFSLLAHELVGWDVIDTYDELLLANDSSYLLRGLDEVFSRMDATPADWWGLQASKHGFDARTNGGRPLDAGEVKRLLVGEREMHDRDHLHLSSYFLCFRRPVLRDPGFRRRLDAVAPQGDKHVVVQKYEIGLSRYLMCRGFDFDTYVPGLHTFHPLYTAEYFDLLHDGFPLLKRNFLSENSRNVPDLVHWKERVLAAVPDAPVEVFERNLLRVAPDDRLRRSFAIRSDRPLPPKPWNQWELAEEDRHAPKLDHWWAFPVSTSDHTLPGGVRAVFEAVRDDPSIKKVVLTLGRRVEVTGEDVVVAPLHSREGQEHLVRCANVFVQEEPRTTTPAVVPTRTHRIFNLGRVVLHDLPVVAPDPAAPPRPPYRAVVVSSPLAALSTRLVPPVGGADEVWVTGDPRNDLLLCERDRLPADLRAQEDRLREVLAGRPLLLVQPSWREGGHRPFAPDELASLQRWRKEADGVLGFRDHPADRERRMTQVLRELDGLNLGRDRFSSEVADRLASALLTDLSPRVAEFAATGKPVVVLSDDRAPGPPLHDLSAVLPARVVADAAGLGEALEELLQPRSAVEVAADTVRRRLLHQYLDTHNGWRLVQRVRAACLPS